MTEINDDKLAELKDFAKKIRISLIKALAKAGSGHPAGSLGMADIFSYLYLIEMRHDPKNPSWPDRDRLILSNGHICPVLYSAMAHSGYFSVQEFEGSLRRLGSGFQGHPHREFMPEVESSSGPLGEGLSQAIGMSIIERMDRKDRPTKYIFCLLGDGELDEGQNWEAMMLASKEKLGNLIAIVDRNNIQIDGSTDDVLSLEPLAGKWQSFGWHTQEIDGHNFSEMTEAFSRAKAEKNKPSAIIAKTVPGKGVSFMEGKFEWHGKSPSLEEAEVALKDLEK